MLLHERPHLGAALIDLRLDRELGHARESAHVGARKPGPERDLPRRRVRVAGLPRRLGGPRTRAARAGTVRLRRRRRRLGVDGPANREASTAAGCGHGCSSDSRSATCRSRCSGCARRRRSSSLPSASSQSSTRRRSSASPVPRGDRGPDDPLQRRVDRARGRRHRARGRAALAPALLVVGPRARAAASSTAPPQSGTAPSSSRLDTLTLGRRERDLGNGYLPFLQGEGLRSSSATRSSARGWTRRRRTTSRPRR